MRRCLSVMACSLVVMSALTHAAEPAMKPIPGVGPAGEIAKLHTGFKFTEGPAADGNGNVYFSDIPNNRIHKVDADGKLSTLLENSEGCNGLMVDARGRLIACQGNAKKLIALDVETKKISVLSDGFDGKPLGTPNDLVIDRTGGIYFTAPDISAVFYLPSAGKAVRVLDGLPRPNGVLLSPDEKILYVLPSGSADVLAYPIERPGTIGKAKVLCKLEQNPKQASRLGGDGLTLDTRGNLYLTKPSLKAIQVVSPEGKTLGLIEFPEEPSNCTFGGKDLKTLYVTAQSSLYTVKMEATGHRFGATRSEEPLPEAWDYTTAMKKVAGKFRGNEGVVIHLGGSMTIANPYGTWPRSGKGKTPDDTAILKWMHTEAKDKTDGWWLCRTELEHYRAYTSESGLKSAMLFDGGKRGLPTLEKLLDEYKPRMVTIECGIYDVEDGVSLDDYRKNMGKALDLILDRGAIPVLNTIPPFKAQLDRTKQFNDALRELSKERGIPVLDLEREIFTRRPEDWFGTLVDRIHLTAGQNGGNPGAEPTAENLRKSGYQLRGWLTVRKVAEIKRRVLDDQP
ncbi:MAG: SMP-30/gluconolactonase/LRE family protein [Planctomycetes bacterium]|nr:SMP-30/gluconolactonase/LRE family protein [Planctomycetota bacterium]